MIYVGLTDNPSQRRLQHGNLPDWQQTGPFPTELAARDWERQQLAKPGGDMGTGTRSRRTPWSRHRAPTRTRIQ
jgi:hypothetical protein